MMSDETMERLLKITNACEALEKEIFSILDDIDSPDFTLAKKDNSMYITRAALSQIAFLLAHVVKGKINFANEKEYFHVLVKFCEAFGIITVDANGLVKPFEDNTLPTT